MKLFIVYFIIFVVIFCIVIFILGFRTKITNIVDDYTNIYILDNFIEKKQINNLKFPDINNMQQYQDSFIPVGKLLSKRWNTPQDETYYKQGVIVDSTLPPDYFISDEWKKKISKIINVEQNKLIPYSWKYKKHVNESNGIWLHTDYRSDIKRNLLILIYKSSQKWKRKYGGELLIFSKTGTFFSDDVITKESKEIIDGYQTGKPLTILNNIKKGEELILKNGIGGEWDQGLTESFECKSKIAPFNGRVIIMDYRNKPNIHAVSYKKEYDRNLIEQWFYIQE